MLHKTLSEPTNILRFANILKLKNLNVDNIKSVVKAVKSDTSLDLSCDYTILSSDDIGLSQIIAVEQKLQIKPSDLIDETLTNDDLTTAAEMFIYLNLCPNLWFKSWYSFYR